MQEPFLLFLGSETEIQTAKTAAGIAMERLRDPKIQAHIKKELNVGPQPSSYGVFSRVIAHYARDEGVLSLPEEIRQIIP